jgi:hypothetical protein
MNTSRRLKQTATYWGPSSRGADGRWAFSDSVEISCRWEQRTSKFVNANAEEKQSFAVVFLAQDVTLGGFLYLGTPDESDPSDPLNVDGAYEIKGFNKIPGIKATDFERTAYL